MVWNRKLDLQAKIVLILALVIVPTYVIVTVIENRLTQPILEEEIKQIGVSAAKSLAVEIVSQQMLGQREPTVVIERYLQEFLYGQPSILRMDVMARETEESPAKLIASSVEDDPSEPSPVFPIVDVVTAQYREGDEDRQAVWEILVPIESRRSTSKGERKVVGTVHAVLSLALVTRVQSTLWKMKAGAAIFSIVTLIVGLSYPLRKVVFHERQLRRAEDENLALTERLHEAQRQLMNNEKLAVMGQLTASFAHEIGTPLNAIGGHLQLLTEELPKTPPAPHERLQIINGQVSRIEQIVKGFLRSTGQPESQRQLVDLNRLIEQTLQLVRPRADSASIQLRKVLDHDLAPVRVAPLDLEQVLLNLVNNSIDSLISKRAQFADRNPKLILEVSSRMLRGSQSSISENGGRDTAVVTVYDTGEGIPRENLKKVLQPFFTTKPPGEGTGLGLPICSQLLKAYGGSLNLESKDGSWTKVTVELPI